MAHASKQAGTTPTNSHTIKTVDKKKSATTSQNNKDQQENGDKTTSKTSSTKTASSKKTHCHPAKSTKTANRRGKTAAAQTAAVTGLKNAHRAKVINHAA